SRATLVSLPADIAGPKRPGACRSRCRVRRFAATRVAGRPTAIVASRMNTLLLKLIVTPVLIGAASLAGRRWGETLSGWFSGLPLDLGAGLLVSRDRAGHGLCRRGGTRVPGRRRRGSGILPRLWYRRAADRLAPQPCRRDACFRGRRGASAGRDAALAAR